MQFIIYIINVKWITVTNIYSALSFPKCFYIRNSFNAHNRKSRIIITPVLQMRKLGSRKMKWTFPSHEVGKENRDSSLGSMAPRASVTHSRVLIVPHFPHWIWLQKLCFSEGPGVLSTFWLGCGAGAGLRQVRCPRHIVKGGACHAQDCASARSSHFAPVTSHWPHCSDTATGLLQEEETNPSPTTLLHNKHNLPFKTENERRAAPCQPPQADRRLRSPSWAFSSCRTLRKGKQVWLTSLNIE